ncbi:MAG: hypothetical protein ABW003_15315 [Microvirga sp.]
MALIDRYVPDPQYSEHHSASVQASGDTVLAAAAAYRTENDPFFRRMIALRELPMRVGQILKRQHGEPLPPFGIDNFTLLERSESEVVFGLAGRFWRPNFDLAPLSDGKEFLAMEEPGIAKLALNFAVRAGAAGVTILSTETRVVCVDRAARKRFAPYWYLIRPVSGLIRRRTLNVIRQTCEDNAAQPA